MDEELDLVTFSDEDGNEFTMEVLDYFFYEGKEYALLEYLLTNARRVIGAEELIEHAWDSEADPFSNAFRFHIHSLRKKLDEAGARDYIITQRGQGYRIQNPEEASS